MKKTIRDQIAALQEIHKDLAEVTEREYEIVLAGRLYFEACPDDNMSMHGDFGIELRIPETYPGDLPKAVETGGEISSNYPHLMDGFLCLETPIGELEQFHKQPVLLGYINRLVIPYLYSYCYWEKFGRCPFGERAHYEKGIVQYYTEKLQLKQEDSVSAIVRYLHDRGYNRNDLCPCGSGKIIRDCHKKELQHLRQISTREALERELRYLS